MSPPSSIIFAFCAVDNHMIIGKIKGVGRDLLVGARLTLIDKPDSGSRPVRLECTYRWWFSSAACKVAVPMILSSLVAASVMMQKAEIIQRLAFSELVSKHYLFIIQ